MGGDGKLEGVWLPFANLQWICPLTLLFPLNYMFCDSPRQNGEGLHASLFFVYLRSQGAGSVWEESQLHPSRPRAVGRSACQLNLRLFHSCWSQPELVLLPALRCPCWFPCCALLHCRGSLWELLTCRACESQAGRQEVAKIKSQVLAEVCSNRARWGLGTWAYLMWSYYWGPPVRAPPGVSCEMFRELLPLWFEPCWCRAVLRAVCFPVWPVMHLCLPSVPSVLGQPCHFSSSWSL